MNPKPKKALGQNFFNNSALAKSIVSEILLNNPKCIVEIGGGTGVFTSLLAESSAKVIVIEYDDTLAQLLKQKLGDSITLLHQDILSVDPNKLINLISTPFEETVIYGSLPYNISKPIISNALEWNMFSAHYYIIQKEVALLYTDLKSNRLNSYLKLFGSVEKLRDISPGSFNPPPNVISSQIKITQNPEPLINSNQLQSYKKFLNLLFANPRKMLRTKKLHKSGYSIPEQLAEKRAENLTFEEILHIFNSKS